VLARMDTNPCTITLEASRALIHRACKAIEASRKAVHIATEGRRRRQYEPTACPFCKSQNIQSRPNSTTNTPLYRCEDCRKAFYPVGVPTLVGASRPCSPK